MIKLHSLTNTVKRQARKRVGRGDGNNWGGTAGRGHKGDKARTGSELRPFFEGGQMPLLRRLPKRGFNHASHKTFAVVNVGDLERMFQAEDTVDGQALRAKGWVKKLRSGLKVLGTGELTKKLTVKATAFSASAKAKIEAAGGSCQPA